MSTQGLTSQSTIFQIHRDVGCNVICSEKHVVKNRLPRIAVVKEKLLRKDHRQKKKNRQKQFTQEKPSSNTRNTEKLQTDTSPGKSTVREKLPRKDHSQKQVNQKKLWLKTSSTRKASVWVNLSSAIGKLAIHIQKYCSEKSAAANYYKRGFCRNWRHTSK